jgi:ribA/ribD-fused uncharacterized protein
MTLKLGETQINDPLFSQDNHKLDNNTQVFFYENDFYPLSNFSAFTLQWKGLRFDTSEAAYHWEKFDFLTYDGEYGDEAVVRLRFPELINSAGEMFDIQQSILKAPSAHEAFKIAERNKALVRLDWAEVRLGIMKDILRAKANQHEYVRRKLLATGDRELIEDSWRDSYWGWGPNKDGQNMLGKLWMVVREELRNG